MTAVYDPGANLCLASERLLKQLKSKLIKNKGLFKTLNGMKFTESRARIRLKIGEIEDYVNVQVVKHDNFAYDLLLGLDAITKFKLIQDDKLNILQRTSSNQIKLIQERKELEHGRNVVNFSEQAGEYVGVEQYIEANLQHLPEDKKASISELIRQNEDIFAKNKFDVGRVKNHEAQIQLSEYRYVAKKPYRCSVPDQKEIDRQVAELLKAGLIEESTSPWAAPVSLAYKKNSQGSRAKERMVIDLRDLNKLIVPEPQPFPRIDDILLKTRNAKWKSTFDINSAFWAIPIRYRDRKKTGFVTQNGHYHWRVLPFGMKTSSAIFQRILAGIIRRNGLSGFCVNFMDDILVFSDTFEEHLRHIELLMKAIRREGLKLKLIKCNFAQSSIKYLGHVIEHGKVKPCADNLGAIREFPTPKCKKNVRQVIGKINFYRNFVDNISNRFAPLHHLLKEKVKFDWTPECEAALQGVKHLLCSQPILAIYNPDKPVYIYTDGSGGGLGAVLKQPQEDDVLHPVAYFSRKLTPGQLKKKAMYLELLAIKECVVFWQYWLIGRSFTVVTDHKPLENLKLRARTDEAIGDLAMYLSQFEFNIVYSPGALNVEADSLSRNPVLVSFSGQDEELLKVANIVERQAILDDQSANVEAIRKEKQITRKGDVFMKKVRNRQRIVVSQEFAENLIKQVHEHYGDIGVRHIADKIRPFYYCRNLDKLIQKFCDSCEYCVKNKSRSKRQIGLLSKLGPAAEPFEIMSIDTVGGFGGNRSSHKYLHLLVDHFSRLAVTSTSKGQCATDFIKLIDAIAKDHDVKLILADQYTGLNSKKLKRYLRSKKIMLVFTSVDHPESNGMVERLGQTLVNRIRCKLARSPRKAWTSVARECTEEYNRTTHSVTKFAPNYLVDGEESHIVPPEFVEQRDLQADRVQALINSNRDFEKNKERSDRNKREHTFKDNDLVYVKTSSRLNKSKMDEIRSGPFPIVRRASDSIYEVRTGKRRKESNFFHSSKLLPVEGSLPVPSGQPSTPRGGEV